MDNTTQIARRSLLRFLQESRFAERFPPRSPPPAIEAQVREIVRSWKLNIPENTHEKHLIVGVHFGYAAYQHTPYAVQIAVALFTFCATMFDSGVVDDMQALREFIPRFCAGQPQLHPILTQFIATVGALREFLPEYSANLVYPSMMSYANEELYCWKGANELTLQAESGSYIEYSRLKSGMPEPFIACIWPHTMCPDVGEYVQAFP